MAAWRPDSVNCGIDDPTEITNATTRRMPAGFGIATTFSNVAFGEVITPMMRARRLRGWVGDVVVDSVMGGLLVGRTKLRANLPIVRPTTLTADKSFMFRRIALLLIGLAWATPASGQVAFEVLGGRALGMGGAFVGVADDATAFHWNPAGMTKGSPASMTVGWDKLQFGNPKAPVTPGQAQDSNALTSVSTWPLGFSYGYFTGARIVTVDADGNSAVRALRIHHLGA